MAEKQWKGSTFGSRRMHAWLTKLLRVVDVRALYVFSGIFIVPVCIVVNPSGKTSYRFYRKRFGYSRLKSLLYVYRNHYLFSQLVLDRFAVYAGQKFGIEIEGFEHFKKLAEGDQAFMHFSSHVGNYEIAGYNLISKTKKMNTVVFGGEKAFVMENRGSIFESHNIRMIEASDGFDHLLKIAEAIGNKEIVSMAADRTVGSAKSISSEFFGEKARFPAGPFTVAAVSRLDVLAVNVMKTGGKNYRIYITPLEYDKDSDRNTRIQLLADSYAAELERILRLYPAQWYNFYDFWAE